jgi:hypothetical protein
MLGSYRVYDADAHVILAPAMWEDLPEKYAPRRPRPATFSDSGDLAAYTSGWLIEGRVEPHILGPGLQPANTPAWVVEGRHRDTHTLMNPEGRVRELDQMGIDVQFLFPSTLYARMTADPGFEAAMFRAYNRFMGRQCRINSKRLKWAGLLSMALPAQMAFVALVGQGMLDRYPDLRIGFMEFGAEWIFYMVGRMDHYLERDRMIQPRMLSDKLPSRSIRDYLKSGRIFMCGEMEDPLMKEEIALLGEDQLLYSSDYPHGEARENAAQNLLERKDVTETQKQKILFNNPVRFFGEP